MTEGSLNHEQHQALSAEKTEDVVRVGGVARRPRTRRVIQEIRSGLGRVAGYPLTTNPACPG